MAALVYIAACRVANLDGQSFVKETLHVRHSKGNGKNVIFLASETHTKHTFPSKKGVFFTQFGFTGKTIYLHKTMMSPLTVFEKPQRHAFCQNNAS